MFPKTIRERLGLLFWNSWLSLIWIFLTDAWQVYDWLAGICAVFACASTLLIVSRWAGGLDPGPVDVWDIQEKVMKASAQRTPGQPVMTNESLLYFALIAEEASEGFGHATDVLERAIAAGQLSFDHPLVKINTNLHALAEIMRRGSLEIRNDLKRLGKWAVPLQLGEAIDLLDDCNDLVVVAAGESLTLGLPGRAGYREVGVSNLSKRNPDTGKIDKTPDGKWIKGRDYRPPDLRSILMPYYLDADSRQDAVG